jgi:peptide/nickel transport system substrate-binding protein
MLVPPGVNGYAPDLDQRLPYDPEAAKALLSDAGYPDGFSVTLDCPNDSQILNDAAICRAIAAQLRQVGIDVTANPMPKEVYYNSESDFWFEDWAAIDSEIIFVRAYRTGGISNPFYSNPRVDELIAKIDSTMITYVRNAMIEEVWKIVLGDVVYVPLHHQLIVWAMRDNLDLPVNPYNIPLFREARLTAPKVD